MKFAVVVIIGTTVIALMGASPGAAPMSTANKTEAKDSYIFASSSSASSVPSGRTAEILEDFPELNGISVADRLACSFTHSVYISSTLGMFKGQIEPSFVLQTDLSDAQVEYIASLLGKYERQESILLFTPKASAHDRLWTIHSPPRDLKDIIALMQNLQVTGATIRPARNGSAETEVWIVDFADKHASVPTTLAARLGGRASSEAGEATLWGDRDWATAQDFFKKQIFNFEQRSSVRLSSHLESHTWKTTTKRSCSSDLPT